MAIEQYIQAQSIEEALHLIQSAPNGKFICGGTDIVVALHANSLSAVETLIDISTIAELRYIRDRDGMIEIGAATTMAEIASNELVAHASKILHKAAHAVGSPQIRNRGSIGGNVVTSAQCADTIPALLVLDATVNLRKSDNSERSIPIADFFTGPKKTDIRKDELLTSIQFPSLLHTSHIGSFYKLIRRAAVAKSRLNFALLGNCSEEGVIEDIRISIGSALSVPGRFYPAEQYLIGKIADEEVLAKAAKKCIDYIVEQTGRRWSAAYKLPVVEDVLTRELATLLLENRRI